MPRSEVFAFAQDPDTVRLWNSNAIEYERITEGPVNEGTQIRIKTRVLGRTFESTAEVTEFEEGRRVVSRTVESPIDVENEIRYEDANGGTRMTLRQEAEIPGGSFGKLADPLAGPDVSKDVRSNLEKLKELLEAQ